MLLSHAFLLILIAAASGWVFASTLVLFLFRPYLPLSIFGFKLWGILPSLQHRFAKELAQSLTSRYLQPSIIAPILNNDEILKQLTPQIEKHVDVFLEQKLPETFPLLAKLMGEKTLSKFKTAFLTEVEVIFPALITSYSGKLLENLHPAILLEQEIKAFSIPLLQKIFTRRAQKQLLYFKITAAFAGAVLGVIQWVIISFRP